MISIDQAVDIVKSNFKGSEPKEVYIYDNDYYMIFAPSGKDDNNTPIYIVGISDGRHRYLNPLEDIDKFNAALDRGPVKNINE